MALGQRDAMFYFVERHFWGRRMMNRGKERDA